MKPNLKTTLVVSAILAATLTMDIYAQGGVKTVATGPFVVPDTGTPAQAVTDAANLHGFDITGFIQAASPGCPGTATVNNIKITIPCNTVVQMPANTFAWNDMLAAGPSVVLGSTPIPYELHVIGNIVNGEYRAALLYLSQQSANGFTGVIQSIDYSTGTLKVSSGDPASPTMNVQINDPKGRFGRAQSPDPRFSVDDANPTIHAMTGYPMCVPRTPNDPNKINPATGKLYPDDPKCPRQNRPISGVGVSCRLFGATGIALPVSGELTGTPAGKFCTAFVMKAPVGTTVTTRVPSQYIVTVANAATEPDARRQAPFEVGDSISVSGTLMPDNSISAHTIEANVGIYTQPKSQPSYLAMGEFGIGTADPALLAVNGAAQETQNRIFLEAATTDVASSVDIYMVDVDPVLDPVTHTYKEHNRWVSMYEMTGDCNPATLTVATSAYCQGLSGGIYTQFTQTQNFRARLRLAKATNGILTAPSRNMRVMSRSLCFSDPAVVPVTATGIPADLDPTTGHSAALDNCINGKFAAVAAASDPAFTANGLVAGQYSAPVFEYIFPENTKPGQPLVPYDLWHLPFLLTGPEALSPPAW